MDNEAPAEFKAAIKKNGCKVELTPVDMHRRNIAERAIQTFKSHLIAVIAGLDEKFPIHEWHRIIPQTLLTLNLLRPSNVSPNVSAYAHHHGQFDYNRMPLAPIGCAVQLHEKPKRRKTFGEHSVDGFYIYTSPDHYRCSVIFVKKTRQCRISDTVYFKHKYLTQPTVTAKDRIMKAILDLTAAIRGKLGDKSSSQYDALKKLSEILQPGNELPIQLTDETDKLPRVQHEEDSVPRVQESQNHSLPRVKSQPEAQEPNKRLVVAWPQKQIVQPQITPQPAPQAQEPLDSIASRLKARKQKIVQVQSSIAQRVAA